LLSDTSR